MKSHVLPSALDKTTHSPEEPKQNVARPQEKPTEPEDHVVIVFERFCGKVQEAMKSYVLPPPFDKMTQSPEEHSSKARRVAGPDTGENKGGGTSGDPREEKKKVYPC